MHWKVILIELIVSSRRTHQEYDESYILCPSIISILYGLAFIISSTTAQNYPTPADRQLAAFSNSISFLYTGAVQTWTVPDGVYSVTVDAYGASGGGSYAGEGGWIQATLAVTPQQLLYVYVGGQAGWNGGGAGAYGNGGDGTDIRSSQTSDYSARLVVAGGGGGGGDVKCGALTFDDQKSVGGNGGSSTGASGVQITCETYTEFDDDQVLPATGGTLTAGGGSGSLGYNGAPGTAGGFGYGGRGGSSSSNGGGGGGGYYGGGGGDAAGGGGGSSWSSGVVLQDQQGGNIGNGKLTISWVSPPTTAPTPVPTTSNPTQMPITQTPSVVPTSMFPTINPSLNPSFSPSIYPSASPSVHPSISLAPSLRPSTSPSVSPTISLIPTTAPSKIPTSSPTISIIPTIMPTSRPTAVPTISMCPTVLPTKRPTYAPTISKAPLSSIIPSVVPTESNSIAPSTAGSSGGSSGSKGTGGNSSSAASGSFNSMSYFLIPVIACVGGLLVLSVIAVLLRNYYLANHSQDAVIGRMTSWMSSKDGEMVYKKEAARASAMNLNVANQAKFDESLL